MNRTRLEVDVFPPLRGLFDPTGDTGGVPVVDEFEAVRISHS